MGFEDGDGDGVDLRTGSDFADAVATLKAVVANVRQMMPEAKKWVKENSDLVSGAASCLLDVLIDVGKSVNKQNAELSALFAKWKMQSMKAMMKEGFSRVEAMQIILAQVSRSVDWSTFMNNVRDVGKGLPKTK